MKPLVMMLVAAIAGLAAAFEVKQVFSPERFTRGNVNLIPMQPIDEAAWVWLDGVGPADGKHTPFVRFRNDF
ncbi:MAG TPA: hypothetical protein PKI32_09930, partial [Opitutales bacterium]|nr:hypothetical protein [Opitutales bacterium]